MSIALALTLSRAPSTVARTYPGPAEEELGQAVGPIVVCQRDESLPGDTSAIRLGLDTVIGPKVTATVFSGSRLLTSGTRGSGWTAGSVTVAVRRVDHAASHVTLCLTIARSPGDFIMLGTDTDAALAARTSAGRLLPGRVKVEDLRAGTRSWWSLAVSVARRMGLGRGISGSWIPLLVLSLSLLMALSTASAVLGEIGGRERARRWQRSPGTRRARLVGQVPRAACSCALVACLNAVCWSLITPPFQVPDEPSHFAYVQLLAEQRELPAAGLASHSPELAVALNDLEYARIRLTPQGLSLAGEAQQRKLERDLSEPLSRSGPGGAGSASHEPPLYYGLEAIPYEVGAAVSLLDRLELMRLLSAVMAGTTALFAYLFIREALPGSRWTWTVGGLAVALFPLLGFISGGVNPDAMLFAICAALYYFLARAFRRGLTPRLAVVIGTTVALGFLTKLNFVGFAPGAIAGLAYLGSGGSWRGAGDAQPAAPTAYRAAALAIAVAVSPVALYALVNLVSNHSPLGAVSETFGSVSHEPLDEISYIWQFYLPRLPGMSNYFPGAFTTRQLWFNGLVGLYGWVDTLFPGWVYDIALVPAGLIAALALRELARGRRALRRRIPELAVYGLTAAGVAALVGAQSYGASTRGGFSFFSEPRYLLPMLALWGLVVALAARGAGRRWGPVVGTLLIVLLFAHDVFSQLQVVARYYG
jgi:Predicted membrane protein (DUF2142)